VIRALAALKLVVIVGPPLRLSAGGRATPERQGAEAIMIRCPTCKRELKDETQKFCNECNRGYGKPGQGTRRSPGRTAARRRRRRGH